MLMKIYSVKVLEVLGYSKNNTRTITIQDLMSLDASY